jgi:SAM-dependent methyltransferase
VSVPPQPLRDASLPATGVVPGPAAAARARATLGGSGEAIHRMVDGTVRELHPGGGTLVDVGGGSGALWPWLRERFDRCIVVDAVRYDTLPADAELVLHDLDAGPSPLPDGTAAVACAVETIEHLENPRALMRELTRLAAPGGLVIVTTPNQLSMLSKLTLLTRNEFNAFRAGSYPAHLTALLEVDLRRIARECGLESAAIHYTGSGRVPLTGRHFPGWLARRFPRALSDNLLLVGRKPDGRQG